MTRFLAAIVAGVAVVVAAPVAAFAQAGAVTVGDAAEAWYSTGPLDTCSSPVGCPPVSSPSAASYPANTLHVAVTAGQTTAVTYVQPEVAEVPPGDVASAGTMTLPLATTNGNGNTNTAAATVEACLATGPFTDGTEASTDTPPPTDCTVKSAVKVGATAFTLDLESFLSAWNAGKPDYGIALLPDPASTGPASDWHVAFNGRELTDAPHISSQLTVASAASNGPLNSGYSGSPFSPNSAGPSGTTGLPAASLAVPAVVPSGVAAQPTIASPASSPSLPASSAPSVAPAPAQARVTPAAVVGKGFQYPEVMLLPLAFAAGIAFVLRVLTFDATPRRKPV